MAVDLSIISLIYNDILKEDFGFVFRCCYLR
jgi:hypothetical protein